MGTGPNAMTPFGSSGVGWFGAIFVRLEPTYVPLVEP